DVSGSLARVTFTQRFRNPLQEKIEAVYVEEARSNYESAGEAVQDSDTAQPFDICYMGIWRHLSSVTKIVFLILLVMSLWLIVIMVERYMTFSAAMNQSHEYAPKVESLLMRQEIDEAIELSDKYNKSHLAMVVSAGLKEFRVHQLSGEISGAVVD